jgi:hypothetical protein
MKLRAPKINNNICHGTLLHHETFSMFCRVQKIIHLFIPNDFANNPMHRFVSCISHEIKPLHLIIYRIWGSLVIESSQFHFMTTKR